VRPDSREQVVRFVCGEEPFGHRTMIGAT
jgi:hypothetical protein